MPSSHIIVETAIEPTFRVKQISGLYDVTFAEKSREEWDVDIPVDDSNWQIGLITGPSGSGKTTIGRQLFGEKNYHKGFKWPKDKAIVDGFTNKLSIKDICTAFCAVGFGSTPNWSRPFRVLSNGEQFRVELARLILETNKLKVIDEFTSVVDRTVAKVGSMAFRKAVDRKEQSGQFVMLSCHYDIIEWLQPDWIYDLRDNTFRRGRLRRGKVKLEIYRSNIKAWPMFKKYHYLTSTISPSCQCFIGIYESNLIAFVATMPQISKKRFRRESRLVVLPDYQGIGFGAAMSAAVAQYYIDQGIRYSSTTSHPGMIKHRQHSPLWRITNVYKRGCSKTGFRQGNYKTSIGRAVVAAEYLGKRN